MSEPKEKQVDFVLSERQWEAFEALRDDNIDEILYGGAKGGGKSVFGVRACFYLTNKIITEFNIKPSKYPLVVGFMGRKRSVDFTSTTLNSWKRFIPNECFEIKKQDKLIIVDNRMAIQYGGLDNTETIQKFNSAEFAFYFLDQAEECSEEDIGMLRGTTRFSINGCSVRSKGLLTANPKKCWLKPEFITNPKPRTRFIKALPSDNPFLDPSYIERLKKAFSFNPALLKAYLDGSWDGLDSAFVVINSDDVQNCIGNRFPYFRGVKKFTVADIAEDGNDETVIYDFENMSVVNQEMYSHRDLMDTTGRIQAHATKNGSNLIAVDKVGIGAGVYSRLDEVYGGNRKMRVHGFDGRVKPPNGIHGETYKNYRAYAWFSAAEKIHNRKCTVPDDPTLHAQLSGVTYHFTSNEMICIDDKEDMKKTLGGSPDRADAFVIGLDAFDISEPVVAPPDKYARRAMANTNKLNPMTV